MDAEQARKSDLWDATDVEVTTADDGRRLVTLTVATTVALEYEKPSPDEFLRVVADAVDRRSPELLGVLKVKLAEKLA